MTNFQLATLVALTLTACVETPAPSDTAYTYRVETPGRTDPAEAIRTVGISHDVVEIPPALALSDQGFEWCKAASPAHAVSKTIWCQACNKGDAEDCARQWAVSEAHDYCGTQISSSDAFGDPACGDATYTGTLCVASASQGVVSEVQVGSDTACGVWPFRHAAWKVTYSISGTCGYSCRS